jgi:predicted acetyltransferase
MSGVNVEYRDLTLDDYDQAAILEPKAFYNAPDPAYAERMKQFFPPDWTVGAFLDGKLVADVRTVPMVRRLHGAKMAFGSVGPVTCQAAYRRRGLVARLLVLAMERMRDRGQMLSGLYTPHDALYQRFGWERAEFKKGYSFRPKDVHLRFRSSGGLTEPATPDDWQRLDRIYRAKTSDANGPFIRNEIWWREAVLKHWESGKMVDSDAVIWVDNEGHDQGYAVYGNRNMAPSGNWTPQEIFIRDFQALTSDAYLGLWEHVLTHDLAENIATELHPDDPFRNIVDEPHKVKVTMEHGSMLRIVDVEAAFALRPYLGDGPAAFTARIEDHNLVWNDGIWRIESADGKLHAERTDATADVSMSVNALAALFTGFLKPEVAANTGFVRVSRPEAVAEMAQIFAVNDAPYSPDYY